MEYAFSQLHLKPKLSFETLKGRDAAPVLTASAMAADRDLHLTLVTIEESGSAYRIGGGWDDKDDFEVSEVADSAMTLSALRRQHGADAWMGSFPSNTRKSAQKTPSTTSPPMSSTSRRRRAMKESAPSEPIVGHVGVVSCGLFPGQKPPKRDGSIAGF